MRGFSGELSRWSQVTRVLAIPPETLGAFHHRSTNTILDLPLWRLALANWQKANVFYFIYFLFLISLFFYFIFTDGYVHRNPNTKLGRKEDLLDYKPTRRNICDHVKSPQPRR